ncbi:hypothetical protein BU24DRAFT_447530 [Aaosphaeria arxii CBS 175.79]|uniref:Uncharacterized protein n=1 Tax=Aaosphaeria arxii CBS 175.79 TaxID=1450172 RepID=A0A6A5Y1Y8_9PLEO|nr:uncharacterized protein BU24DRAFT_447530 [Aaosphaeria arxii CBS 175.79]KAF2018921.1 hypothetical protein BU24DRAFT_447530 [Aaosphaeria arxii CBS 175.79]
MAFELYSHNRGSKIMLVIAFLVVLLWALLLVEIGLGKKDEEKYLKYWNNPNRDTNNRPAYPDWRWGKEDYNGVEQLFSVGSVLILEIPHLTIHHILLYTQCMHPVGALCTSLIMGCCWFVNGFFGVLQWLSNLEDWSNDIKSTDNLQTANAGLSFALVLAYWVYMGFSASDVHKWRKEKKILRQQARAQARELESVAVGIDEERKNGN